MDGDDECSPGPRHLGASGGPASELLGHRVREPSPAVIGATYRTPPHAVVGRRGVFCERVPVTPGQRVLRGPCLRGVRDPGPLTAIRRSAAQPDVRLFNDVTGRGIRLPARSMVPAGLLAVDHFFDFFVPFCELLDVFGFFALAFFFRDFADCRLFAFCRASTSSAFDIDDRWGIFSCLARS